MNGRVERAGGDQLEQRGEVGPVARRLALGPDAPVDPDQLQLAQQDPVGRHGGNRARGEADHQRAALPVQRAQGGGEDVAADVVEQQVDGRQRLAGQHHLVGAGGQRGRALGLGADDRRHLGAQRAPEVDRGGPDPAARAGHAQPFAGPQPAAVGQPMVGGAVGHQHPGRGDEIQPVGQPDRARRPRQRDLGEAARCGSAATRSPTSRPLTSGPSRARPRRPRAPG